MEAKAKKINMKYNEFEQQYMHKSAALTPKGVKEFMNIMSVMKDRFRTGATKTVKLPASARITGKIKPVAMGKIYEQLPKELGVWGHTMPGIPGAA